MLEYGTFAVGGGSHLSLNLGEVVDRVLRSPALWHLRRGDIGGGDPLQFIHVLRQLQHGGLWADL